MFILILMLATNRKRVLIKSGTSYVICRPGEAAERNHESMIIKGQTSNQDSEKEDGRGKRNKKQLRGHYKLQDRRYHVMLYSSLFLLFSSLFFSLCLSLLLLLYVKRYVHLFSCLNLYQLQKILSNDWFIKNRQICH